MPGFFFIATLSLRKGGVWSQKAIGGGMVFEPGEDLFALCCEEETGVNGDEVHIGSPVVSRCPRKRGITKNPDVSFLGIGVLGA